MNTNVFEPSPLKKNPFNILAKVDIDFNATSCAAVQHFHGTSITAVQFVSEKYLGSEILCNTDIGRSSHTEVFLGKGVLKICSKLSGEHLC